MAKRKRNVPGGQTNNSQKSKSERIDGLLKDEKEKRETELLYDERVAAKIAQLDQQGEENKEKFETRMAELEEEYKGKEEALLNRVEKQKKYLSTRAVELSEQKALQEAREKKLSDMEAQVKERCEAAAAEEVLRIKADERSIREQEMTALYAEWNRDKSRQKKELEEYVKTQRQKADEELEMAHAKRVQAEEQRLDKLHEADALIETKWEELTKGYEDKMAEYMRKKLEFDRKLQELEDQRADLDADSEYVRELKAKYDQYSEKEVLKLQHQIGHYEVQIEVLMARIKELTDKTAHMQGSLLDEDGRSLAVRIEELEGQLEEAVRRNDELANMPSEQEIERLRANSRELEAVRDMLDDEKQKRHEAEAKISAYAMSARELENSRVVAAALESLNDQLQKKLKYISDQYKSTQESKFKVLLDIDKEIAAQGIYDPKGFGGTLEKLCDYIRKYGASKKKLYYSIDTIRVFFASLAASERASRLLVLQGLSGTGKSSLPRMVAEALGAECKLVPVQPSWRDNRELLGYDNDFTNRFKETEFTKFLYEASAVPNRNKVYFIVLDEMNLARIEYYFADFLSVLEKPDQAEWIVPLVSGYSEADEEQRPKYLDYSNEAANICVTNNIWFVGTANNDDSTSLITDKVYDRAQVLDMDSREEGFSVKGRAPAKVSMDVDELLTLFENAKAEKKGCLDESDRNGIGMIDEYLKEMDITFGNRIMSQMDDFVPVYVACGGTKVEAIDYLLSHKILRKLDERYEPYLLAKLGDLKQGLDELYGAGKFAQSIKKIDKLCEKIAG